MYAGSSKSSYRSRASTDDWPNNRVVVVDEASKSKIVDIVSIINTCRLNEYKGSPFDDLLHLRIY